MKTLLICLGLFICTNNLILAQLSGVVTTNTVYVSKDGNDVTGERNRLDKPFASVIAANTAAQFGDEILVLPGDYTETNSVALKEGVSLSGKGVGITTLRATNALNGTCLILLTNSSHTIQNMTLVSSGWGIGCKVMNSVTATNIVLRNLDVTTPHADALSFFSTPHTVQLDAYNCKFKCKGNVDFGIDLILTPNSKLRLFNCEMDSSVEGAVLLNNAGKVEIYGGAYTAGGVGGIIVSGSTANIYVKDARITSGGSDIYQDNGTMTVSDCDFKTSTGIVNFSNVEGNELIAHGKTVFMNGAKTVFIRSGTGSPEGIIAGSVGSMWMRTDGGTGSTLYVKESGTGNTGWVAK